MERQGRLREQVLGLLAQLKVPCSLSLLGELFAVLHGQRAQPTLLLQLLRTEARSFQKKPEATHPWILPTLHATHLAPVPGFAALSLWEAERRLMGARSARVYFLQNLLALLDLQEAGQHLALRWVILRHARAVPGALSFEEKENYPRIREAIHSELAQLLPLDQKERSAAVKKLLQLSKERQLWGLPMVLEGERGEPRGGER